MHCASRRAAINFEQPFVRAFVRAFARDCAILSLIEATARDKRKRRNNFGEFRECACSPETRVPTVKVGRFDLVCDLAAMLLADLGRGKFFARVRCSRAIDLRGIVDWQFAVALDAGSQRDPRGCGLVFGRGMAIGAWQAPGWWD